MSNETDLQTARETFQAAAQLVDATESARDVLKLRLNQAEQNLLAARIAAQIAGNEVSRLDREPRDLEALSIAAGNLRQRLASAPQTSFTVKRIRQQLEQIEAAHSPARERSGQVRKLAEELNRYPQLDLAEIDRHLPHIVGREPKPTN